MPRPGTDGALALGVMHVLVGEGRVDQELHPARHARLHRRSPSTSSSTIPERVAAITGLAAADIVAFARRYGATRAVVHPRGDRALPPRQRRHDVPDHRVPARADRRLRASGGRRAAVVQRRVRPLETAAVERPDLMPDPAPRVINMIRLGRALTDPDLAPPVKALYVYNANPAADRAQPGAGAAGASRREDLFTVVHEQHLTDTTDYADLVLPGDHRRWSTPTATSPTATSTCSSPARSSRRRARRARTGR